MVTITREAVDKAFAMLDEANNLIKGNTAAALTTDKKDETVVKAEDMDWDKDDMKKALDQAAFLQKGGMTKEAACDVMTKGGGFSLEVAQASWEKALAAANAVGTGGAVTEVEVPFVKSEEVAALVNTSLEPVNGSLSKMNDAITKGFDGLGTIIKSLQEQNEQLVSSNNALSERLAKIESQPVGRKSMTAGAYIDRFEKSKDSDLSTDENCYNVTIQEDLDRLTDNLFERHKDMLEKGRKDDGFLEGTINHIEMHKKVPEFAYRKLAQMGIKLQMPG